MTTAAAAPSELSARIAAVLAIDAAAPALEFEGRWRTWGDLAATVEQVAACVPHPGAEVGILLRNRPASVGLLLGVLRAGGCVVAINPGRGEERTHDDVAALDLALLAGETDDLGRFVPDDARATLVATSDLGRPVSVIPGVDVVASAGGREDGAVWPGGSPDGSRSRRLPEPAAEPRRREVPGASSRIAASDARGRQVAVRMLTSGTTGPPKRVDLTYRMLERVLLGAKHYESDRDARPRLRRGVALVNSPLVHLGGLFRVLMCVSDGRSAALLERFTVDGWVDAVRRHRPATSTLVPTALRMVLEADPDPADLASLRSVVCGTAPLDPDDGDAFTARYGVPVLVTYAATEFGGGVAGWNLADHAEHWAQKRGSVGRAHPGCELRVVDPDTGQDLGSDEAGLLEVRADQIGDDGWVRTTDLARLDADGFLFILGRADQAIIRGGFKVLPDDVRAALERHPAVRGAAVVGRDDRRLGAVPVAVVELRPGAEPVGPDDLLAHAGAVLARYELPAEIRIVDELPRTDSGKVDLAAVAGLFQVEDSEV